MEARIHQTDPPTGCGRWTWWAWCLWLPGCVGFGALLAWVAFEVGHYFAPLLVYPLMIGFVLGAAIVALMRISRMGHRPTAWLAVGFSVAVAVVGQHYLSYRSALDEAQRREEAILHHASVAADDLIVGELAPVSAGLGDYLQRQADEGRTIRSVLGTYTLHGSMVWLSWALDGLLVLLPAVAMVAFGLRRPFCGQCGSWYATRRAGQLDARSAGRLAELFEWPLENAVHGAHFRLMSCDRGCTPTGFSLSWGELPAAGQPGVVWLDDARRNRVVEILDQACKQPRNPGSPPNA
ncbi:MAG: hypothetical protein JW888_14795 [Pirellulales bacterium]|nr:hypothetical protein [Pirellulales bacterium]